MTRAQGPRSRPVIFTDLDGTLLHPKDYSFTDATEALALIKKENVPLVFTTSKTRAEVERLRSELSNTAPFITENGGGVFIPRGYFPFDSHGEPLHIDSGDYETFTLGTPYHELRESFLELRDALGVRVRGFGDMSTEEVARMTGLSPEHARLAMDRDFDEPFIFTEGSGADLNSKNKNKDGNKDGDEERQRKRFLEAIRARGLNWTRGRFHHILGHHDKAAAMSLLMERFKRFYGNIRTLGLGDSLNDLEMLTLVDSAVLVQKTGGAYEPMDLPNLKRAEGVGPRGWNRAVLEFLGETVGETGGETGEETDS